MACFIMRYAQYAVRLDDPDKDISLLCFRACYSSLHVHSKGGGPEGAWCSSMREHADMTVLHRVVGVGGRCWQPCPSGTLRQTLHCEISHVRIRWRSSERFNGGVHWTQHGTFSVISRIPGTYSPNHVRSVALANKNRCLMTLFYAYVLANLSVILLFFILESWQSVCATLPWLSFIMTYPCMKYVYSLSILSWLYTK